MADVLNDRAAVFDKQRAREIKRLRVSHLGVVEAPKFSYLFMSFHYRDLTRTALRVNADTDFSSAPPVLGFVANEADLFRVAFLG